MKDEDNGAACDPQGVCQSSGQAAWRDTKVQHPARSTVPPNVLVTERDNSTKPTPRSDQDEAR